MADHAGAVEQSEARIGGADIAQQRPSLRPFPHRSSPKPAARARLYRPPAASSASRKRSRQTPM